jgi:hypothetical protein
MNIRRETYKYGTKQVTEDHFESWVCERIKYAGGIEKQISLIAKAVARCLHNQATCGQVSVSDLIDMFDVCDDGYGNEYVKTPADS